MEKLAKGERNRLILMFIGFLICMGLLVYVSKVAKKQEAANVQYHLLEMKMIMEAGYVQGQADAMKDTIRVRPINDSTYVWISSPWGTVKPLNDTVNVNILHK
jgi:hypothetical protein